MTLRKKLWITIACLSVILCTLVTGSIAWLTDKTGPVVNEFTPSNIAVQLTEGTFNGKMVPGTTIDKVATVTVTNDIACYVFIEVAESTTLRTYIDYVVDTSVWTQLGTEGNKIIYYKLVENAGTVNYDILGADTSDAHKWGINQVYVSESVGKTEMKALIDGTVEKPTLTFTAYACQKEGFDTPAAAWEVAKTTPNPTNP